MKAFLVFAPLLFLSICLMNFDTVPVCCGSEFPNEPPQIEEFLTEQPSLTRTGRTLTVFARLSNPGNKAVRMVPSLAVPAGIKILEAPKEETLELASEASADCRWKITASAPGYYELKLELKKNDANGFNLAADTLPVRFLEARPVTPADRIPAPVQPERTSKILVGAHNCPLWSAQCYDYWSQLQKHPERMPALGFYNQEISEVADWETKWAAEHGVDFFIYCWYRTGQNGPVKTRFAEAIHDALYRSLYQKEIKFTIMWENQSKGVAGVSDENDLLKNLFPYWMKNYFKKDNYLKIDNKPVLFIYRPEFLINDLGSVEKVRQAFGKIRAASKKEGFDGLVILGEYRGSDPERLQLMKDLGLDYTFSYCWPISNSPAPNEAIGRQLNYVETIQNIGIIPQIVTASQAWSGWRDEGSIWKLPPDQFEILLRRMKNFIENKIPADQLGHKMLILDNWNEWGEGHYLLPYTEYGFGYLDAIANVFTKKRKDHEDLIPGDLGKGNYDELYRQRRKQQRNTPPDPDQWTFEKDPQGWKSMMNNSMFEVKNGKLCLEAKTNDPACCFHFKKFKNTEKFKKIRIKMKVSGLNGQKANAQFLWISQSSEDWSERKSVHLPLIDNGKFNDYVFVLSGSYFWRSNICGIRFDYSSKAGVKAEIDEIVFEK